MKSKEELQELDAKYMFHPVVVLKEHEEKKARVIVEGKGSRIKDIDGKEYLDAFSSLWNVVIGHGQKQVADAIRTLDIPLDRKEFRPHLTLGRVRSPRGRDDLVTAIGDVGDIDFGRVDVSRIVLMKSVLKTSGAEYSVLHAAVFGGA